MSTSSGSARTSSGSGIAGGRTFDQKSASRVLKVVYSGAGIAENVQHVDNRPGHAGPAYDDTYSKNVAWKITWLVTIQNDAVVNVSDPVGSVTGSGKATVRSNPTQSCAGKVGLPGGSAHPSVPINFSVLHTTQQFVSVRLTYQSPYPEVIPLAWADVPSCPAAVFLPEQRFAAPGDKAIEAWAKSEPPAFKIALFDNYRILPNSFSHVWTFGPAGPEQKKFIYRWHSLIQSKPA